MLGKILKYLIPLIISVGLCYLLFTGVDFDGMMETIRRDCDFRWIGLALALSFFSHFIRARRWGIQLSALGIRPPFYALVYSIFGTYAVNLVFPRLGEVWRTGYIAHRQDAQFTTVFGSMVADRLSDTVTVALITLGTFILASGTISQYLADNSATFAVLTDIVSSPWTWAALVLCVVIFRIFMVRKTANPLAVKIKKIIHELWEGFAVIARMPRLGEWIVLTVALWGCYFLQMYVAFQAFPFTREVLAQNGIIAALVTFVLSSISMGVPSNGGIGPWQWAVIFALGMYGVADTPAAAFANLVLGTQTILLIILGIITFAGIALDRNGRRRKASNNILNTNKQTDK